jgi:hypothetical protein
MQDRMVSVTFHVDVRDGKPWFRIPKAIAKLFSLKSGDVLAVSISTPKGETLYHGLAKLDSAATPYKMHIGKRLTKGKEIRVKASLPRDGNVVRLSKRAS